MKTSTRTSSSTFLGFAIVVSLASGLQAQTMEGLEDAALSIAAYESSKDTCYYEPIVGQALAKIDAYYDSQASFVWTAAKERGERNLGIAGNVMMMLGGKSKCQTDGLSVWHGLASAIAIVGPTPELMAELARLNPVAAPSPKARLVRQTKLRER